MTSRLVEGGGKGAENRLALKLAGVGLALVVVAALLFGFVLRWNAHKKKFDAETEMLNQVSESLKKKPVGR